MHFTNPFYHGSKSVHNQAKKYGFALPLEWSNFYANFLESFLAFVSLKYLSWSYFGFHHFAKKIDQSYLNFGFSPKG